MSVARKTLHAENKSLNTGPY